MTRTKLLLAIVVVTLLLSARADAILFSTSTTVCSRLLIQTGSLLLIQPGSAFCIQ